MDQLRRFKEEKQDCLDTCERMVDILKECDTSILGNTERYLKQLEYVKAQLSDEVIRVPVVAEMSSGKSTFLNALLFGESLLDAAIGETTAKAFKIVYGERLAVRFAGQETICVSLDEMKEEIKRINIVARAQIDGVTLIKEDGSEVPLETPDNKNNQEVLLVELQIPNDLLKNDLIIYDTPGFGSINEKEMLKVLNTVLPVADGIIWLLDIAQGMKKADIEMLAKLFEGDNRPSRWFVIYTKLDTVIDVDIFESKEFEGTIETIKEALVNHKEYQKYLQDNTKLLDKHLKTKLKLGTNIFTLSPRKALRSPKSAHGLLFKDFQESFWNYIVEEKTSIMYEKLTHFTHIFNNIITSIEEQASFARQMGSYNEEELETLRKQTEVLNRIKIQHLPELTEQGKKLTSFESIWNSAGELLRENLYKEFSGMNNPSQKEIQKVYSRLAENILKQMVSSVDTMRADINTLVETINKDLAGLGVKSGLSALKQNMDFNINNNVSTQFETKQRTRLVQERQRVPTASTGISGAAGAAAGAMAGNFLVGALGLATGFLPALLIFGAMAAGASAASEITYEDRIVTREVLEDYAEFDPTTTAKVAQESFFDNLKAQGFYDICEEMIRQAEMLAQQVKSECEHLIYITENAKSQEEFVASLKSKSEAVDKIKKHLLLLGDERPSVKKMLLENKGDQHV
ncbi:MAG: dynamin family protein [Brevinema sp.]